MVKKIIISFVLILSLIVLNIQTESIPFNFNLFYKSNQKDYLRIMTYNIGLNSEYQKQQTDSLKGLINFIKSQDPDILVLPESRVWNKQILKQKLDTLFPYNITNDINCNPQYIETFIYSKYPIANVNQIGKHYIYSADIKLQNNKKIKLIACHLSSNQWHSSLTKGNGLFENIKNGYKLRAIEVQDLNDSINIWKNKENHLPLVICGDMNDFSGSPTLSRLQKVNNLNDAWWKGGFGYGATFWNKGLYLRLDHILYSKEFRIQQTYVPHVDFSDHYPLIADFYLNN